MDEQKKMVTMATAEKIRYYRRQKGMSQEELALKANLNPAFFGQVERGLKCPTVDTLYKIAKALETPLPELVRFDSADIPEENIGRLKDIAVRIPADKAEQAFKLIDSLVELLSITYHPYRKRPKRDKSLRATFIYGGTHHERNSSL